MIKLLLVLLASFSFTCAYAGADADVARVKAALKKNNPQLDRVGKVYKSNILGLYEVEMDGDLLYTDEKARYLIHGSIFDLKSMHNLTDARSRKLFAVDFDKLPFNLAVKKVKGNGQRKMAYFTDPNCAYCKKLEEEIKNLDNVTLYVFMLTIFPGSGEKVQAILCSKNPAKAWDDLMQYDTLPPAGKCETPTEQVMQLSRKLKVNGTPALFFADGVLVPGYKTLAELEKALNGGKLN